MDAKQVQAAYERAGCFVKWKVRHAMEDSEKKWQIYWFLDDYFYSAAILTDQYKAEYIALAHNFWPTIYARLQQLEAENARLAERCEAAETDLKMAAIGGESCGTCRHCRDRGPDYPCDICDEWCRGIRWEWRGPQGKEGEKQ